MSLAMLLAQIRQDRGLDLELYKRSFLERRLAIRLDARQCPDYDDYAQLLRADPGEYEPLLGALRIHVTCFFRDESFFQSLHASILPALIRARAGERKLRLWCAGGASGEEAYSLAILVCSLLGAELPRWQVRIDSTDIDPHGTERARHGLYAQHSFKALAPDFQRLVDPYLAPVDSHRQVLPPARSLVAFSVHDLTRDSCPAGLDLILCRNVLIYFDRAQQERLYQSFYQAIRPLGYLALGKSEILPMNWSRCFLPADLREHVYQRAL